MLEQHLELGNTLCLGGAHIVLAQHIQHGGAHQPGNIGGGVEAQGKNGQNIVLPGGNAHRGQQIQLGAEEIHGHGTYDEAWYGNSAGGHHDNNIIQQLAPVQRGQTPQRNADAQSDQNRDAAQSGGYGELGEDDVLHLAAPLLQRGTEVALQQILHVGDVITEDDLHMLSPGDGYKWAQKDEVIGKTVTVEIPKDEVIYPKMIK